MWVCPKCGRTFKRTNQGHYCGAPPKTVSAYIEAQAAEAQPHLTDMVNSIRNSVPDAEELILWSMPTYRRAENSISLAACKNHVSLYIGIEAVEAFREALDEYTVQKSAVYFPYDRPLPLELIGRIAAWRLNCRAGEV